MTHKTYTCVCGAILSDDMVISAYQSLRGRKTSAKKVKACRENARKPRKKSIVLTDGQIDILLYQKALKDRHKIMQAVLSGRVKVDISKHAIVFDPKMKPRKKGKKC